MKKAILFLCVTLGAGSVFALDSNMTVYPNPLKGNVTNTTIIVSSATPASVVPTSDYVEVTLSSSPTRYFYRIDNSTINIPTVGFPVNVGETPTIRAIKGYPVYFQSAPANSTFTVRAIILEPK